MRNNGITARITGCLISFYLACMAAGPHSSDAADTAASPDIRQWSISAQQKVEGYAESILPSAKIGFALHSSKIDFVQSKPSIQDGTINIQAYVPAMAERGSGFDEIWCKLKTRGAISQSGLAGPPQGEPGTCMAMNQAAIDWALHNAPEPTDAHAHEDAHEHAHEKPDIRITCIPDETHITGGQWVQSSVRVVQDSQNRVTVQSSSLRTPDWVPRLGGNQYCKLLSPRGAAELVACIAGTCDPALVKAGDPYAIGEADGGMYTEGSRYSATAGGDALDIYLPNAGIGKPLAAAIFLQGAKCDKQFYSAFAKHVASYGFVVAVANHSSLLGKNFTDQSVVNRVWDYVKSESRTPLSPLYKRVATERFALVGHSYGGVACLNCLQGACSLPTCIGFSYAAPKELSAVIVYGTHSKSPVSGKFQDVATRGIPVLYINGDRDGKAHRADTLTTFREKTSGGTKAFATVHGANHYSITDLNNPPGGDSDPAAPTLPQQQAIISIARVSGIFMLAHIYDDPDASRYIYAGERRTDPAVSIETE